MKTIHAPKHYEHPTTIIILFVFTCLFLTSSLFSQTRILVPITVTGGSHIVTDTFGTHINATYCNDGQLDSDLIEEELPIFPPPVFGMRFVEHRSGSTCLGVGQRIHIQEPGKRDTFKLEFDYIDSSDYPLTLSWPQNLSGWTQLSIYDFPGGSKVNVDMLTDTGIQITDMTIRDFLIIGESVVLDVDPASEFIPSQFVLYQNYPNPFNPSTTIRYQIPRRVFVSVRIFNPIGQEINRLVNEVEEPGQHTVEYNASTLASGVYYYVLLGGNSVESKKFVVLK